MAHIRDILDNNVRSNLTGRVVKVPIITFSSKKNYHDNINDYKLMYYVVLKKELEDRGYTSSIYFDGANRAVTINVYFYQLENKLENKLKNN